MTGRGIATAALAEFLGHDRVRPLHALVAVHYVGSIRVLEKCGFVRIDTTTAPPDGVEGPTEPVEHPRALRVLRWYERADS